MKTLVIGHLTGKDIAPHIPAEGQAVTALRERGVVRDVFLKVDRTGPILIVNDANAEQAAEHLKALPFVEHDLVTFEYVELADL
ncbi:MAG TPA: hypothetical protein VFV02_16905 [Acidimicrobiales bacterium]|nr:hypothetical protein [Acidimicrobiales bacterium]